MADGIADDIPSERKAGRRLPLFLSILSILLGCAQSECLAGLPKRLVLLVDGVSHRDVVALQAGITYKDPKGRIQTRQAFNDGYFPASRMISTFPSASDVAWTDIFGNRPLPGYQRTYFSAASGLEIEQDGIATSMEYELQMHWQLENENRRKFGYLRPTSTFKYEVRELLKAFMQADDGRDVFYGMIRASDDAQHTSGDMLALLCHLETELKKISEQYQAKEGRKLEILMLSDHGNDHAGSGKRVAIRPFLKKAGYRVTDRIRGAKDIILPTVGIQSWVEIHCSPAETESLAERLTSLAGVDCVTARVDGNPHQFIVLNSKQERARIDWKPELNSFRYTPEHGDPLNYGNVLETLSKNGRLTSDCFATADAWMAATLHHRYPLAPERIARGHSALALNPAPILLSLANGYVHSSWLLKQGSSLIRMSGTHGSLDDLASNGVLLSNFAPTVDTSTGRVAALYNGFPGLRNYRDSDRGAEWIYRDVQALTPIARTAVDQCHPELPDNEPLLRIWTPGMVDLDPAALIEVTLMRTGRMSPSTSRRGQTAIAAPQEQRLKLQAPLALSVPSECERVYEFPVPLTLEPQKAYRILGETRDPAGSNRLFDFNFQTDSRGLPVMQ